MKWTKTAILSIATAIALSWCLIACGSPSNSEGGSTTGDEESAESVSDIITVSDIKYALDGEDDEEVGRIISADVYAGSSSRKVSIVGLAELVPSKGIMKKCGYCIDIEKGDTGEAKITSISMPYEPSLGNRKLQEELQGTLDIPTTEEFYKDAAYRCIKNFEESLYDPYSARYGTIKSYQTKDAGSPGDGMFMDSVTVEFDVNAKNRFGGYVGSEHYVFYVHDDGTIERKDHGPMWVPFESLSDLFRRTFEPNDLGLESE